MGLGLEGMSFTQRLEGMPLIIEFLEPRLSMRYLAFELDVHSIKRLHETWMSHRALTTAGECLVVEVIMEAFSVTKFRKIIQKKPSL